MITETLDANNIKYSILDNKIYLDNTYLYLMYKNIKGVLDVSRIENLQCLWCDNNKITEIKCNKNLQILICFNNQITKIICNDKLQYLSCWDNKITELDIPKSLTYLSCKNNNLLPYYVEYQDDLDKLREIIIANKRVNLIKELLNDN